MASDRRNRRELDGCLHESRFFPHLRWPSLDSTLLESAPRTTSSIPDSSTLHLQPKQHYYRSRCYPSWFSPVVTQVEEIAMFDHRRKWTCRWFEYDLLS